MITDSLEKWFLVELDNCCNIPVENNLALLEKITVIVPSYNRQDYLLRLLLYWVNSGAQVIIVDGSPQSLGKSIQAALLNHPNLKYIHNIEGIENRLALAAKCIETPYAVMSGDDEFHLKLGLCKAIKVLDYDLELVGCIGQSIQFGFKEGNAHLQYGKGYPHYDYSILQDELITRLVTAMSTYNAATCYAVMPKLIWQRSWGNLQVWSSPYVAELQQALTTYIQGKFSTVKEIYWLRSFEVPPVHISKTHDRRLSFYDWWISNKYISERDEFVNILTHEVMLQGNMQIENARQTIIEAVEVYIEWWRKETIRPLGIIQQLRLLAGKIVRALLSGQQSDKLKTMIGMPIVTVISPEFELGSLAELKDTDTDNLFALNNDLLLEMKKIEEFVANFYQARDEVISHTEVRK